MDIPTCGRSTRPIYTFVDSIKKQFSEDPPLNFIMCNILKFVTSLEKALKYITEGVLVSCMEHLELTVLCGICGVYALATIMTETRDKTACATRAPDATRGETWTDGCVVDHTGVQVKEKDDIGPRTISSAGTFIQALITPLTMFVMPQLVIAYGTKKFIDAGYIPKMIQTLADDNLVDSVPKLTAKLLGKPTVTGAVSDMIKEANKSLIPAIVRPEI